MTNPIELLPQEQFRVLKVIRIEGPEWNRFTAYLPYLRTFDPKKYDANIGDKGDLLDEKILHIIKEQYPDSILRYNSLILFEGELEDNLRAIEGGSILEVTIQLFPLLPYENLYQFVGKSFTAYPFNFKLRVHLGDKNPRVNYIQTFYLCNLPYDQVDDLAKTIKSV